MDEGPTEPVDSDQPRYQLRNRTTAVPSSSSHVLITSHANLPAIGGCMAEGRSSGEAAEASLVDPPLREMSQLSQYWRWDKRAKTRAQLKFIHRLYCSRTQSVRIHALR